MAKNTKNIVKDELSARERLFAFEYLQSLNTCEAARNAGYSPSVAESHAYEWLIPGSKRYKPQLADFIKERIEKRAAKLERTGEEVIQRLWEVNDRCMQKIVPVLDKQGQPVLVEDAEGQLKPAYVFDAKSANTSLGLLGKHYGVIKDKQEVEHKGAINVNIVYKKAEE